MVIPRMVNTTLLSIFLHPFFKMGVQRGEIDIISVMQYVRRHYLQVFDLMQRGKLHLEGFIGARFPLSGLQQAFDYLHEPNTDVMKVAIMVQ